MESATSTSSTAPTSTKKIWSLYYDNAEQKVVIYPGTQLVEILQSIRLLYNFAEDQELLFLDEDGLPIILSSVIPHEAKLFMQKKQSVTDKFIESLANQNDIEETKPTQVDWHWLTPSNESHMLKNNDLTVYQPVNNSQSRCNGSLVMKSGVYYYTLLVEPVFCCVHAGIESTTEGLNNRINAESVSSIELKSLVDPNRTLQFSNYPTVEFGFYVNMDSKVFIVTDHRAQKVLVRKTFTWDEVRPQVFFKHEVSMTITNKNLPAPDWI